MSPRRPSPFVAHHQSQGSALVHQKAAANTFAPRHRELARSRCRHGFGVVLPCSVLSLSHRHWCHSRSSSLRIAVSVRPKQSSISVSPKARRLLLRTISFSRPCRSNGHMRAWQQGWQDRYGSTFSVIESRPFFCWKQTLPLLHPFLSHEVPSSWGTLDAKIIQDPHESS